MAEEAKTKSASSILWNDELSQLDIKALEREKLQAEVQVARLQAAEASRAHKQSARAEWWDHKKVPANLLALYVGLALTLLTVWSKMGDITERLDARDRLVLSAEV